MTLSLLLGILAAMFVVTSGQATEADFLRLYSDLLDGYRDKRHMRPIVNQSADIEVTMTFKLVSVMKIDEVKQDIFVQAEVLLQWHDKNLVWTPSDYGGLSTMYVGPDTVWTPDIVVAGQHHLRKLPSQYLVLPSGQVNFAALGELKASCNLDMTYFPYDRQTCRFDMAALESSKKDINLLAGGAGFDDSFLPNGVWDVTGVSSFSLTSVSASAELELSSVLVEIKLTRRPAYYIINILLPVVILSVLAQLTFVVPVESGERLSYTLTVLLSLSVYFTSVASIMPQSSVIIPVIMRYLAALFIINSLCIIATLLVIAIRWSHVHIATDDHRKVIHIFAIPVTVPSHTRHTKVQALRAGYQSQNENIWKTSADLKPEITSDREENDRLGTTTMRRLMANRNVSSSAGFPPLNQQDVDADFGSRSNQASRAPALTPDNGDGHDVVDPDVARLATRVNNMGFIGTVVAFLLVSVYAFVAMQDPEL